MIRHFFTDKEGLFAATVSTRTAVPERLTTAFHGDRENLGARITAAYLAAWDDDDTGPILRAIVRTAFTSERSAGLLREILTTQITDHLDPGTVEPDELPLRLILAGSHLLGVAAARNLAAVEPLADLDRARLVDIVAPAVQHYLTGPLPAA